MTPRSPTGDGAEAAWREIGAPPLAKARRIGQNEILWETS
jgi:hypothetical protein